MPARTPNDIPPEGEPLELLYEDPRLSHFELPEQITRAYGGGFGLAKPCLFANFVASVDGVVALPGDTESGQIISGKSVADRFVMGLLRASADAVVIGAGTFRKSAGHLWQADRIYPAGAELFAEARTRLGLAPKPRFVLVSESGNVETSEPALKNAIIATTRAGAEKLRPRADETTELLVLDADRVHLAHVLEYLRAQGLPRILTEGGPSLFSELAAGRLLDELFVTSSPKLFGRFAADQRKSLADGLDLAGAPLELLSLRRHHSHLFARYALR